MKVSLPVECVTCHRVYDHLSVHRNVLREGETLGGLCPEHVTAIDARLFGGRRSLVPVPADFSVEANR